MVNKMQKTPDRAVMTKVINDNILERLSLQRRYNFLNNNLQLILKPNELEFLKEVQKFCMEYERQVDHSEDLYDWYKDFGAKGYICRSHSFEDLGMGQKPWGLTFEFMRDLAVDFFDCQLSWSIDASVLSINPIYEHHDNVDFRLKALKELIKGEAVGCICITEPERGSDATHQLTISERKEDGLILNGVKVFNTNAPKSKYAVVYGTKEPNNPNTMTQSLIEFPHEGVEIERVFIPGAPRVYLGKETFTDVFVPYSQILGDVGKGKAHMFEGLVPERISIAICNISLSWNAITHASIYANLREQMGKSIIRHQSVGFTLADLWAKITNLTRALLNFCRDYDDFFNKYNGKIPPSIQKGLVTAASQLKYDCAREGVNTVYECVNLMGGAGVCDNTMMWDLLGTSKVQEIVGGTRQIQQYIMSGALRSIYNMDK